MRVGGRIWGAFQPWAQNLPVCSRVLALDTPIYSTVSRPGVGCPIKGAVTDHDLLTAVEYQHGLACTCEPDSANTLSPIHRHLFFKNSV